MTLEQLPLPKQQVKILLHALVTHFPLSDSRQIIVSPPKSHVVITSLQAVFMVKSIAESVPQLRFGRGASIYTVCIVRFSLVSTLLD